MPTVDRINPSLCDAWISQQLFTSSVLVAQCGGSASPRFYQDISVPTPDDTPPRTYPFVTWSGGAIDKSNFYSGSRGIKVCRIVSQFSVRQVRRSDSKTDWSPFDEAYQELRSVLLAVPARTVTGPITHKVFGSFYASSEVESADIKNAVKDGDNWILERGITVRILHL